ncbi:MAG: rhomboid family intramembrane serine protease [Bacteroidetes bacterium]|nr:rhomboid family intramembrane serine protease [Bacteroidota bacterium]
MRPFQSYSQRFLLIAGVVYLLNSATKGLIGVNLELYPSLVLQHFQLWRILTYPIASLSISGMMLLSLSLYFFGEELEMVFRRRLPLFLLAITLFQGIGYTLLFQDSGVPLAGGEAISFYILTLFLWTFPRRAIDLFGLHVRGDVIILIASFIFLTVSAIEVLLTKTPYFPLVTQSGLGIFAGLLTVFMYMQSSSRAKTNRSTVITSAPSLFNEEYLPVESDFQQGYSSVSPALRHVSSYEHMTDEEQANILLDKIFSNGTESLSSDEREFLEYYSKNLK